VRGRVFGEGLLRLVMRLHPRRFRVEYSDEMVEYYRMMLEREGRRRGFWWRLGFLGRSVRAAAKQGLRQRLHGHGSRRAAAALSRGSAGAGFLDALSLDFRYAVRSIGRRRRFAAAVVIVLALGMGANTAVFGVLNAVLLRPLPYPDPDRLVRVYQVREDAPGELNYVTAPAFVDLRDNARSFESIAAAYTYSETGADLTGDGDPIRVRMLGVTPEYVSVVGTGVARGRAFGPEHAVAGSHVVVVSWALAESRGLMVGGSLVLDGRAAEVLGVLPAGFEDPIIGPVDVLTPLVVGNGEWEDWQWDNHYLTILGRLEPDATLESSRLDVARRYAVMKDLSPMEDREDGRVRPLHEDVVGNADVLLVLLMAAVGFLLLIACVNVAGLFLARGAARKQELAVRSALGSPRWRVIRQLLIESLLLSFAGAAVGLLVGRGLAGNLVRLAPVELLRDGRVPFDLNVFGFGLLVAAAAGVIFGLVPALLMTRTRIEQSLRQSGRGGSQGERERRSRDVLVVAQLALSFVLLVGAGLLIRSFERLRRTDLGFRTDNVVTFQVNLPESRYDAAARIRFHEALHQRLSAIPGVRAVAAVSHLPVTGRALSWGVREFLGEGVDGQNVQADQRTVQGDYFSAARIPLIAGRTFDATDDAAAPARVVISQTLAQRLFPGDEATGHRLRVIGAPHEIIGVVGDAAIDARGEVVPVVYHSHRQFADNRNWSMQQIIALDAPVPGLIDAARSALASIDRALVLHRPDRLENVVRRDTARDRFATLVLSAFAAVAILLAAVGVYGVLAHSVTRRRHEFGVRMALGARAADVRRMVVGRGIRLTLMATGLGLLFAAALSSLLSAFVYGVGVRDPVTFVTASGLICVVALLASLVPAVAATRVDPVSAFRSD
jgi:putative ABC transport system permease protein